MKRASKVFRVHLGHLGRSVNRKDLLMLNFKKEIRVFLVTGDLLDLQGYVALQVLQVV